MLRFSEYIDLRAFNELFATGIPKTIFKLRHHQAIETHLIRGGFNFNLSRFNVEEG